MLMRKAQETGFRGQTVGGSRLQDLILLELAIREQARLDEDRRPLADAMPESAMTAQAIADREGWKVSPIDIDRACQALRDARLLEYTDGRHSGIGLSLDGRARAADLARSYLGEPLRSWKTIDPAFEDCGQVEVEFLGSKYIIGCVAGEEGNAIRLAERFEIDAGEVTKAVSDELDDVRAMLMAGVLAYERLEEFEDGAVETSDRLLALDHSSQYYLEAAQSLQALINVVRENNLYRESDEADQERRLAELEAGRALLQSRLVSVATLKAALWTTLAYLALKFADAPIGEAADLAWKSLKRLLGVG
jgi:cell division protein ZapA (FtsZ GTPase activity inhibitor)